jgi:hypothetical protein
MRRQASLVLVALPIVLVAMALPALAQPPLISSPANGTLGLDSAAPLTLAWTTIDGASTYIVELSENRSLIPLLPLKDPEVPARAGRLDESYLIKFSDGTSLAPGRKYYWRVSAVVNGTRVPSDIATFTTVSDPFSWLVDHNFSLTRAEDGVDKNKPAAVGFIRQGGPTPSQQVTAEFLLGWEGNETFIPKTGSFALSPQVMFAGKMSSAKQAEDTLAKIGGGAILDWSFGEAPVRSLYQTIDVSYEGDQAFDDAHLLIDYLATYSGPGVGRFVPKEAAAPLQLLVRPSFLLAYDGQAEAESTPGTTQTRVGGQVDVKVRLNALARALGISGSLLSVTDRWLALSGYERDTANSLNASLDLQIAKGFTFGFAYRKGHDAPAFRGVNRMALTLGIGFGG